MLGTRNEASVTTDAAAQPREALASRPGVVPAPHERTALGYGVADIGFYVPERRALLAQCPLDATWLALAAPCSNLAS